MGNEWWGVSNISGYDFEHTERPQVPLGSILVPTKSGNVNRELWSCHESPQNISWIWDLISLHSEHQFRGEIQEILKLWTAIHLTSLLLSSRKTSRYLHSHNLWLRCGATISLSPRFGKVRRKRKRVLLQRLYNSDEQGLQIETPIDDGGFGPQFRESRAVPGEDSESDQSL